MLSLTSKETYGVDFIMLSIQYYTSGETGLFDISLNLNQRNAGVSLTNTGSGPSHRKWSITQEVGVNSHTLL